jgi:hypothetical protein
VIQRADKVEKPLVKCIYVSPTFGKPITAKIDLRGEGPFNKAVLGEMVPYIMRTLAGRGYIVSGFESSGQFGKDGIELFESSKKTMAHEEMHQKRFDAGCKDIHKHGYHIIDEGAANARADWIWTDAKKIDYKKSLGQRLRDFSHMAKTDPTLEKDRKSYKKMLHLVEDVPIAFLANNWTAFLIGLEYYGGYDLCMTVFEHYHAQASWDLIDPMRTAEDEGLHEGIAHLADLARFRSTKSLRGLFHTRSPEFRNRKGSVFGANNGDLTFKLNVWTGDSVISKHVQECYAHYHDKLAYMTPMAFKDHTSNTPK